MLVYNSIKTVLTLVDTDHGWIMFHTQFVM